MKQISNVVLRITSQDILFSQGEMTKFIRIGISDKNDNPPYFDKALYEAEVDENEDIQHTVLTVTAKDKDECKCQ
ncbi:Neural-cadherin [Orchesella cincta]|uniref:Neural-cadherin n=1 Tax=Orchesella cincta TaxID=48709 RepID=A0A1D2M6A0_ORCCI|nr:Neural-cadherin [Orchesella cincta]